MWGYRPGPFCIETGRGKFLRRLYPLIGCSSIVSEHSIPPLCRRAAILVEIGPNLRCQGSALRLIYEPIVGPQWSKDFGAKQPNQVAVRLFVNFDKVRLFSAAVGPRTRQSLVPHENLNQWLDQIIAQFA